MSWLFASVGQSIGTSASESVLPINIQSWCCLGLTGLISFSPVDSQESSLIPQFKSINYLSLNLLYGPTLTSKCDYWKNYSFDCMDLCWQSNISGFNMLSRFITAFLPRRKCFFFFFLISWLYSPSAVEFGEQENKVSYVSTFSPSIFYEVVGPIPWSLFFECWVLSHLFHSSFTFIKRFSFVS